MVEGGKRLVAEKCLSLVCYNQIASSFVGLLVLLHATEANVEAKDGGQGLCKLA